ncbi:MAG: hypothetical protein FJY82_15040, partial [Candidatus Aminicenantes bacterium]|nr:hypothetical protein [Candidatus Aminicenantes bacterium]
MNKHLPIAAAMFLSLALSASAGIHLALFGGYAATPGKASGEAPVFGAGLGIDLTPTLSLDLT